jgi:diguanylate cyclase (GGDEF)-like protein
MPSNPTAKTQINELEGRIAELEQRLVRLTALHRVAQSVAKSPTANQVFVELAREIGAALPRVYEVSVSAWDRRRGVIRDIFEFKPQQNRRVAVPGHEFALAPLPELHALLRAGRGSLVSLRTGEDTSDAQVAYMKRFGWYSLLQAPLASAGRTLGVIEIADCAEARPWEPHEVEFCETLASQAAVTLQHAQLFERIRHMADHDALTGLANPRVFHRRAAAAEHTARRHKTPLGVLVIDIDNFKRLNDAHGHAHGDRVLRDASSILRRHARESDTAGRLGGDELALLLPRTSPDDVEIVADRLVRAYEREGIGVSIGLAAVGAAEPAIDGLVELADQALLKAKRRGKRRIERAA